MQVERDAGLSRPHAAVLGLGTGLAGGVGMFVTTSDVWERVIALPAGAGGAMAGGAAAAATHWALDASGLDEQLPAPAHGALVGAGAGIGAAAGGLGVFRAIVGRGMDARLPRYGAAIIAGGVGFGALAGTLSD